MSANFSLSQRTNVLFLLAKLGCEDFVVHGEDDNHSYATGDHGGNDALDGVAQSFVRNQCDGNGVPDTGKQIHHQKHHNSGQEVQSELGNQGAVALKGHIALEREIDTLPKENGGEVGQGVGQAACG